MIRPEGEVRYQEVVPEVAYCGYDREEFPVVRGIVPLGFR